MSGQYAWNEDIAGAEIVAGKGKATPMPAAVQERLIRFWASPQGAPKAAILGVNDKSEWGANPATLLQDGLTTAGKTSLTWEGAKAVLTFPIPGVAGATGTATLDAKFMAERVVVRELTTTETETGSVYVVMPVPASVKRAITVTATAAPDRPLPEPPTFMRVVEKFTRQGNAINYEVTIEDPEVLVEPWVMTPRTMRLIPNAEAGLLPERGNCEVYEEGEITSQIRP